MTSGKILAVASLLLLGRMAFAQPAKMNDVVKEPTKEAAVAKDNQAAGPLDFAVKDINGKDVDLKQYKGKIQKYGGSEKVLADAMKAVDSHVQDLQGKEATPQR